MEHLKLCVNFGLVASEGLSVPEAVCEKTADAMKAFLAQAQCYNDSRYGFSGSKIRCTIYSGDGFCPEAFSKIAEEVGAGTALITSANETQPLSVLADTITALDLKKQSLNYPNTIAEYIVNKSDAVFLLWDGKQGFQEGILWAVLQSCKQKKVPYYLLNTQAPETIAFSLDSDYAPYTEERMQAYVKDLYGYEAEAPTEARIPLSRLWIKLHDRFIRKYKLKAKNIPYVEDKLLSKDYYTEDTAAARNHELLAKAFAYYDAKAIEASSLYRASIYFRSILPMIATILVAIGFYAETVLTFLLGKQELLFGIDRWVVLAALGFLAHALVNRYASRMSKNTAVAKLRKDFVEARAIAEHLRLAIHSETYGIQIGSLSVEDRHIDKHVLAKLHHIIRQQEPVSYTQTEMVTQEVIANLKALAADQRAYHENGVTRYELITRRLDRFSATFYMIGFVTVVARGFLQFAIPFAPLVGMDLSAKVHDIGTNSFIKSAANMMALVLPAWASYFSTKLNMNGYEWLWKNSKKMAAGFEAVEEKLRAVKPQRNSYQIISDIADDIMMLAREDYTGWYQRMESQKFTRL